MQCQTWSNQSGLGRMEGSANYQIICSDGIYVVQIIFCSQSHAILLSKEVRQIANACRAVIGYR